jgi:predicted HAD superfamily hydrolase
MKFSKLVPNIFYENIEHGIQLFVECLEFGIGYSDLKAENPCCVVQKDSLAVFLFQDRVFAAKDRPEVRLHTDNIDEVYEKISRTHPQFLHPNLKTITLRPWGAREFALRDSTNVCVIIQQWR